MLLYRQLLAGQPSSSQTEKQRANEVKPAEAPSPPMSPPFEVSEFATSPSGHVFYMGWVGFFVLSPVLFRLKGSQSSSYVLGLKTDGGRSWHLERL